MALNKIVIKQWNLSFSLESKALCGPKQCLSYSVFFAPGPSSWYTGSAVSPAKWNKKESLFLNIVVRIKWYSKYVKNTLYVIKCYRHYCCYITVVVVVVINLWHMEAISWKKFVKWWLLWSSLMQKQTATSLGTVPPTPSAALKPPKHLATWASDFRPS